MLMTVPPDVLSSLDIRSRTIIHYCARWFSQDKQRCIVLLQIIQRKSGYSLRIIDWMMTNFCKRFPVTVIYGGTPLDVYNDYKRHLTVFNKRFYDPFARRQKIPINVMDEVLMTTVGQLNFFKWFLDRELYNTITLYLEPIEHDMKECTKSRRKKIEEKQSRQENDSYLDTSMSDDHSIGSSHSAHSVNSSVIFHRGRFEVGF